MLDRMSKIKRESWLTVGGLLGVFHETVIYDPPPGGSDERIYLLGAFLVMMGLPVVWNKDESDKKEEAAVESAKARKVAKKAGR